jgi:hypothetical protein
MCGKTKRVLKDSEVLMLTLTHCMSSVVGWQLPTGVNGHFDTLKDY